MSRFFSHQTALIDTEIPEAHPDGSSEGLSQVEAQRRLKQFGYNELPEKKANPILKFLSYFWGPIPWMIDVATILSALIRHWADFVIILALLVVNAIFGFWEEYQAGNTIAALKAKLALKARVKREAAWTTVPARELVSGDVIRVRIGDIVPADARLLEGDQMEVDQSTLTGESLPLTRKVGETIYSASIVKQGEMDAVVSATGQDTYMGKTARLVETTHITSHFQRAVLKIGDFLIIIAIALVFLIIAVALFRHDDILTTLQFALVLMVASIPVAMPAVLSITMAVGARLLAQKQAVVSRLVAIEELAGIDVLCSDKTGTLTQNRLTMGDPFVLREISADQVILYAALASRGEDQDPINLAILNSQKLLQAQGNYQVIHFQPFDPVSKRAEATVRGPDGPVFKVTKGAPQVICSLDPIQDQIQPQVEKVVREFATITLLKDLGRRFISARLKILNSHTIPIGMNVSASNRYLLELS